MRSRNGNLATVLLAPAMLLALASPMPAKNERPLAPAEPGKDWAVLVRKAGAAGRARVNASSRFHKPFPTPLKE